MCHIQSLYSVFSFHKQRTYLLRVMYSYIKLHINTSRKCILILNVIAPSGKDVDCVSLRKAFLFRIYVNVNVTGFVTSVRSFSTSLSYNICSEYSVTPKALHYTANITCETNTVQTTNALFCAKSYGQDLCDTLLVSGDTCTGIFCSYFGRCISF